MAEESLSLTINNLSPDTVLVEMAGTADVTSMHIIRKEIRLHSLSSSTVILDIEALEYMSSMVIGYFLMLASELQGRGGILKIRNANSKIAKAVRTLGVPGLLFND